MFLDSRPLLTKNHNASIHFYFVYLIAVVFNFQALLIGYSASTFIEQYVTPLLVGIIYAGGAFGSMLLFLALPTLLRRFGNVGVSLALMTGSIVTLLAIIATSTPSLAIIGLVAFLILNPLIYLNIDIFFETLVGKNETGTGRKRGLVLALMSATSVIAPLSISFLVGKTDNLIPVFWLSICIGIIFMFIVVATFRKFYDPVYEKIHVVALLNKCWRTFDIRIVLMTHLILQIFFTWTVVYFPLYLASEIGLSWGSIGTIIAAGIFAYTIFEFPIGILADDFWGEKEMMAVGFLILALCTAGMTAMTTVLIWPWMILMFTSRIGASLVEVTTESHFFKKVQGEDAPVMSIFRLMRPLGSVLGALLGSVALVFMPFKLIFLVLAAVLVMGIFITLFLRDTR